MKIKLPYSVKSFFELPLADYEPVLSPYDFESIVLSGLALHPRIAASGIHGDTWVQSVENCDKPVFVNSDRYVCNALAGFSHEKHGLALYRGAKGFTVETGDGLKLSSDEAIYAQAPGSVIVALHDSPWTHIVTASYGGISVFERAYKGKPLRASKGYQSFGVVFQDGRSVLVYEDKLSEAGFPVEAVAYVNNIILAKSSGWLVWMEPDMPKPTILVKDAGIELAGFHQHLPVFKVHGKLHRLEGGALVDLNISVPENSAVTASDVVVVDSGDALYAYDVSLKPLPSIPKEETAKCWAAENKIFCCTRGLCGVIEPGESFIYAEPVDSALKEAHVVRVASETPATVIYNDVKHRVKPGNAIEIREENASILDSYLFNIEIHHLLGSTEVFVESQPSLIELNADAKAYVSTGMHLCGGLALLELDVREIKAPSRVKVLVESTEVKPGKHSVCLDKAPSAIEPTVLDTLTLSKKALNQVSVESINIPEPSLAISIKHERDHSAVRIETDAEKALAKLVCRNGVIELSIPESTVRNCIAPAHVEVELRNKGFIYRYKRDIVLRGLIDYVINNTGTGLHEYREGGFTARYAVPAIPEVNPLSGFKLAVSLSNVDIRFKSRVVGRLVVVAGQSVKSHVVRPGLNTVTAPFTDRYYLVFDSGFSKHAYKLELQPAEQLRVAEMQALALYSVLARVVKQLERAARGATR